MPPSDRELSQTLDLIAKLVASVSDRLDSQGEALAKLTQAQAKAHERIEPQRIATAAAATVEGALVPHLHKIVDVMQELNGGKAILRARLAAVTREEARASWWRRHVPFALTLGGAYALVLVFGLAFPRAMAEHRLTCQAIGGTWYAPDASLPASCTLWLSEREPTEAS